MTKVPKLEDSLVQAKEKIRDLTAHLQEVNHHSERKSLEITRLEEANKELKARTIRYENMYMDLGRDYKVMSESYHFLETMNSKRRCTREY